MDVGKQRSVGVEEGLGELQGKEAALAMHRMRENFKKDGSLMNDYKT